MSFGGPNLRDLLVGSYRGLGQGGAPGKLAQTGPEASRGAGPPFLKGLPIGPSVVPFCGLFFESYEVTPKGSGFGGLGFRVWGFRV